ncbi:MAG: PAS domain S-box protein [Pseudomonadota bacterium]
MDKPRPLNFEHLQGDEATESIDFTTWVPNRLTFTGSFDLRDGRALSFTKLLEAIPIPVFLIDGSYFIVFANSACGHLGGEAEDAPAVELNALFPLSDEAGIVRRMAEATFATRKPHVTEATVKLRDAELSGRIHLRSLRMGDERFILALVEDLTLEKRQIMLNRQHREDLINARNDLEKRVEDRTKELTSTNIRLRTEILERRRADEELRKAHDELEQRVQERTSELRKANGRLITEILHRKEAEKALKKSEDKFRTIFRHSLDVILVINGDNGTIIDGNDAVRDVLNYEIRDIAGKHLSILYPQTDESAASNPLQDIRPRGSVFEAQRILCADAREIPMDLTATIIPWEGGKAILATFRDVGDRESALEALRESEERYRTLFDQAANAIFVEDEDGRIVDGNRAAAVLTGYGPKEIVSKRMPDLCLPAVPGLPADSYAGEQGNKPHEMLVIRSDGSKIPVEVSRAPLKTGTGTLFLSIASDITDRKRVERLTLAQRDLSTRLSAVSNIDEALQIFVDTALDVSKMDSAGIFLSAGNSGFELEAHRGLTKEVPARGFRLPRESLQTRQIMAGRPIYLGGGGECPGFSPFDQNEAFRVVAAIPIHHEGRIVACSITASRTMDEVPPSARNELESITAQMGSAIARLKAEAALREAHQELEIRVDMRTRELVEANKRLEQEIAQRKTADEHNRKSLKEKEALLQEVHHRVKNNLQIISSLLALQAANVQDEKTLGALKDSQSRIRSMAFIHEHLYQSQDLARIDFGEYIKDLMGALLQSYSHMGNRVSLKLDVEPVFLGVGTAIPCGLIMNELVSNCLRHAFPDGREGQIHVRLRSTGVHRYELSVVDDGAGLPKELDYRQSNSLGLRLVTNLTELQLRGNLQVGSCNGTTVRIEFQDREQIRNGENDQCTLR